MAKITLTGPQAKLVLEYRQLEKDVEYKVVFDVNAIALAEEHLKESVQASFERIRKWGVREIRAFLHAGLSESPFGLNDIGNLLGQNKNKIGKALPLIVEALNDFFEERDSGVGQ